MTNFKMIGDVKVPAHWEICSACRGEGMSSAYLGAYTREEFDQEFDYEEQERYFAGEYDRPCEVCEGSGKILEIDYDNLSPEQKEAVDDEADYQAAVRSERRMHDMGYQF